MRAPLKSLAKIHWMGKNSQEGRDFKSYIPIPEIPPPPKGQENNCWPIHSGDFKIQPLQLDEAHSFFFSFLHLAFGENKNSIFHELVDPYECSIQIKLNLGQTRGKLVKNSQWLALGNLKPGLDKCWSWVRKDRVH